MRVRRLSDRRDPPFGRAHRALASGRRAVKEAAPPRAPRLRRLTDEEIALWTEVPRGVSRRRGASLPTPSRPPASDPTPASAPPPAETRAPRRPPAVAPPILPIERRLR